MMIKPGSSKKSDDQLMDNSENFCRVHNISKENPLIECEICQQWYLIRCQRTTKAEYGCIKEGERLSISVNYTGIVKLVREWQ